MLSYSPFCGILNMRAKTQGNPTMNINNNIKSKPMMILISVESRLERNKAIWIKLDMITRVQLSTIGYQWMSKLMFITINNPIQIEETLKMLSLNSR